MEQTRAPTSPAGEVAAAPRTGPRRDTLRAQAGAVLARNWRGRYTARASGAPAHQWTWDSAFVAIGLAPVVQHRAQLELATALGAQWPDGRIPQVVFDLHTPADAYFPGPRFWSPGAPATLRLPTSGLVAPPLHARAAWTLYRRAPEREAAAGFLRRMYEPLCAWHAYLRGRRDLGGGGLAAIVHPWESEAQASPTWDLPTDAEDADGDAALALAAGYRDRGCADAGSAATHGFAVEDPLFNGVLAWSEEALARIATTIGADHRRHLAAARELSSALVTRLFDPATGMFLPRDLRTGRLLRVPGVAGLAALVSPDLPVGVVARTCAQVTGPRFAAPLLPGHDRTAPGYDPARPGRGAASAAAIWLVASGLRRHGDHGSADALAAGLLRAVATAGCRQDFDPDTGTGTGAYDVSRTAAVVLDLLV